MTGYEGEEIVAGWLLSNGARLIIDVRQHHHFISNHVDFIIVKDKAFMLECKTDERISETNNFCFEVARCYLNSDAVARLPKQSYHAWGFHSIANSMLIYSPQKHQIFEILSLENLRKWITPEQIKFAPPVASPLSHKGSSDNLWDKVTYNWLINVDNIIKANLGKWNKMYKSAEQYKELFKESLAVVIL